MPRPLALLPVLVAALAVSRSLVAEPPPEFHDVVRALEAASIPHTVISVDDAAIRVRRESERYRDFGGTRSVGFILRTLQSCGRRIRSARCVDGGGATASSDVTTAEASPRPAS